MRTTACAGHRRRGRIKGRPGLLLLVIDAALLALLQTAPASLAVPDGGIDIPQPIRVERFNPDQQACLPKTIRTAYASHLQPWADQPPAVLEQLRRVQQEMTRASLQRCVSKGLLQPTEASELERELGLQAAPGGDPAAAPNAKPAEIGRAHV